MKAIRKTVTWLQRHRVLSVLLALAFVGIVLVARTIKARSEGMLVGPIQRGTIVESVYGIGTVVANRSYQIRPGVISTINAFYVKEGDAVKKGNPLVQLDRVVYHAPFDGVVTYLPFKTGENVFAQVPVLTLVDLQDRYLVVNLEQQGALQIRRGQKVKMSFDSIRQQAYDGVVQSVYSNENNFLARIDVSYLPPMILPGMTADVAIEIRRQENVILVPVAALIDGHSVWVKRGHPIPIAVEVKTGVIDKDKAEVVSGDIRAGDYVIIKSKVTK